MKAMTAALALCGVLAASVCQAETDLQEKIQKYGYEAIPEADANTLIEIEPYGFYGKMWVMHQHLWLTCNGEALDKAGYKEGFRDLVIRTRDGEAKLESLCSCMADYYADVEIDTTYPEELTPRDEALMDSFVLEKVTAIDPTGAGRVDITALVGIAKRPQALRPRQ